MLYLGPFLSFSYLFLLFPVFSAVQGKKNAVIGMAGIGFHLPRMRGKRGVRQEGAMHAKRGGRLRLDDKPSCAGIWHALLFSSIFKHAHALSPVPLTGRFLTLAGRNRMKVRGS